MCSVCAGLVWRGVAHDCPPAVVASSPPACSYAGLQSYVGDGSITFAPADMHRAGGVGRHGA